MENYSGLTQAEVDERRKKGLVNGSFNVPTKSISTIFKENLFTLFNLINVVLAVFVIMIGSYKNALFMGVILSNIAIGIFQEIRAKRTVDKLSLISAPKARVVRDGKEVEIPAAEIVLDELCVLENGMQVCADCEVVDGECTADESLVTGESDQIRKKAGAVLLSGSFITAGRALARADKIGAESYANRITGGAKYIKKPNSVMLSSINKIIRIVSICIAPLGLILFYKSIFITEQSFNRAVESTVAALIAMIPEGLVLLTSLALAVSVIRLGKRKALAQDLYCIETLARVDVLCLDKTGTITEGKMAVEEVISLDGSDVKTILGAFAAASEDKNATIEAIRAEFPSEKSLVCTGRLHFSSAKKLSAISFADLGTFVLGAPEFVLGGNTYSIKPTLDSLTEKGLRVLVLAHSDEDINGDNPPEKLVPIGIAALTDKLRPDAEETLAFFRKQGVEIKIISGDNPKTVASVAKRAGVESAENFVDMSGVSDGEIAAASQKYTVFGRVSPYQKLELVKALKNGGHTVAMTGDGANDVLALKEADCGIAMQSGSDAARNVSSIVLLDSSFASMPHIVAEGRRSVNNIERSASLFLTKTTYAFLLAVFFVFVSAPYPFAPIQMTLMSALAIGIPSFVLALEPNESIIKGNFLLNIVKRSFPGGILILLGIITVAIASKIFNISAEKMSTMAVLATGGTSLAVLYNTSKPLNRLRSAMFGLLAGLFAFGIIFMRGIFEIEVLSLAQYALCAVIIAVSAAAMHFFPRVADRLINKAYKLRQRRKHISAKRLFPAYFTVLGAAALWLSITVFDFTNTLHREKPPVFAVKTESETYKGLFYQAKKIGGQWTFSINGKTFYANVEQEENDE